MISLTIFFAVATFSDLSSSYVYPNSSRLTNFHYNQWEIEDIHLQRWNRSTSPEIGAAFSLYRSYHNKCGTGAGSLLGKLVTGTWCGAWVVPDTPISCQIGIATWGTDPPWNPDRTSSWFTCDTYPRAVEGDEEVSEEKKKWLKWRIFDLQERDQAVTPATKQFISAKLEIVNGIPIKA
jgi:hypothetical protein